MRIFHRAAAACAFALCATVPTLGQSNAPAPAFVPAQSEAAAASAYAPDPLVERIAKNVSTARLRALDARLVAFGTRNTLSEQLRGSRGVFAARDWLAAQFRALSLTSHGRMTVALDTYLQPPTSRTPRAVTVSSVIATLRGDGLSSPTFVISGHFDSRVTDVNDALKDAPGADDNASGSVAVLEAARALAAVPVHANIVFAIFDGEEQGLWGSAHFAKTLRERGIDVQGDLNNDIIGASAGAEGTSAPNEVRIFSEALPPGAERDAVNRGGSENDSPSREFARFAKETGELYLPGMHAELVFRRDRFLRGGDHLSFNDNGFPGIRYTEPIENFAHQHQDVRVENGVEYGDLLKFVDFDYLTRVTKMNVATLAALALGPAKPGNALLIARELTNDTTLEWQPARDAVSYELVWRRTNDATWRYSRDVGNATSATARGYSKDNWIFGVRAVDARGIRSVVAFPQPLLR